MSHVYYFGTESFKPAGQIEFSEGDFNVTRVLLNDMEGDTTFEDQMSKSKRQKQERKFVQVASAKEVVYIVDEKGELWAFGAGSKGQLGLDENIHKINKPQNIHRMTNAIKERVKQVAACQNHTLIVTESNKVYGWGEATFGKLLDLDSQLVLRPKLMDAKLFQIELDQKTPTNASKTKRMANTPSTSVRQQRKVVQPSITSLESPTKSVSNLAQGHSKTDVTPLLERGHKQSISQKLQSPKIQDFTDKHKNLPIIPSNKRDKEPLRLQTIEMLQSRQEIEESHEIILPPLLKKQVSMQFNQAEIGRLNLRTKSSQDQQNIGLKISTLVAVGFNHSLVYQNGTLFSFGKQENGLLGLGEIQMDSTKIPLPVLALMEVKLVGIASNQFHNLAWDINGCLYSWGFGAQGQLGHPIEKGYSFNRVEKTPKLIKMLKGKKIIQASCGMYYSTAISLEGDLFAWGKGDYSREKEGDNQATLMESLYPRKLMPNDTNAIHVKFIKVSSGTSHNASIDQFGRLYTWGNSADYCLGHPIKEDFHQPKMVKILKSRFTMDVSCGDRFTVVIQEE